MSSGLVNSKHVNVCEQHVRFCLGLATLSAMLLFLIITESLPLCFIFVPEGKLAQTTE